MGKIHLRKMGKIHKLRIGIVYWQNTEMAVTHQDLWLGNKTVSHLSANVVNRLLHENRKTISKFLSGKKLFKNVTLQILNLIPVS